MREGIRTRRWAGTLPGERILAKELQVSVGTVHAALKQLETEALLSAHGAGRARVVVHKARRKTTAGASLRVGILPYESPATDVMLMQSLLFAVSRSLEEAGHKPFMPAKTMSALRHRPGSILKMMLAEEAEAWLLVTPRLEVTEALLQKLERPLFTIGGQPSKEPVAGVTLGVDSAMAAMLAALVDAGHRRICALLPPRYHRPTPSRMLTAVREGLAALGLRPGSFNTPEWDGSREGLRAILETLFKITPPTALIVDDVRHAVAIQSYFAERGIRPGRIALIVIGQDPVLAWMSPAPGVIHGDVDGFSRQVIRWVQSCADGRPGRERVVIQGRFESGFIPVITPGDSSSIKGID